MNLKQTWPTLKETAESWSNDRAPSMGAAISYYAVFSIAPLLVIIIAVAGMFFGAEAVQGAVFTQISDLMGDNAAKAVAEMLQHANRPETGGLAALVSTAVLLLGATTVLAELQSALDLIWRVPAKAKENGLWAWLRSRLLTFSLVLALAFLMVISLVMSAAVSAVGKFWGPMLAGWEVIAHFADLLLSFGLMTVIFAVIYKLMPRASIRWHDVWIGAAFTSLLFTIGKILIGLYLGKSNIASGFGAFGSLALVLVWVYYSAQIFLFGAEFTWVFANKFGSRRGIAATKVVAAEAANDAIPATEPKQIQRQVPAMPYAQPRPSFQIKDLALPGAFVAGLLLRIGVRARFGARPRFGARHRITW